MNNVKDCALELSLVAALTFITQTASSQLSDTIAAVIKATGNSKS